MQFIFYTILGIFFLSSHISLHVQNEMHTA